MHYGRVVLLTIQMTYVAALLFAQSSTSGLKDFGNRIEGTAVQKDAAEDLRIVGLHRSFDAFSNNADLQVRFFLPGEATPANVSVEAVERQDVRHYFMHSKQQDWTLHAWNIFAPWNSGDVIDKLNVRSSNIAVAARMSMPGSMPEFIPVDVSQAPASNRKNIYTFYLATAKDLHSLTVYVTDSGGHATKLRHSDQCTSFPDCAIYAAHTTQAVPLDFTYLNEGKYFVTFSASMPGSTDVLSITIPIYHKPD